MAWACGAAWMHLTSKQPETAVATVNAKINLKRSMDIAHSQQSVDRVDGFSFRWCSHLLLTQANHRKAFSRSLSTTAKGTCARIMGIAGITMAAAKV